ncbi:hypothetical protein MOMA_00385 [Moraxella macacae 0408225]|uniref:Uncharacterized protein n=1 Tax=Moraxella macacae 0408225 TaxID=1230338 RepID=L2F8M3_9GAMM|nr:hypothetical protein [Moraxella macacae]ELA08823.1 hypothetical protein MOMA_00385 [Moraxella macacae 0408225]
MDFMNVSFASILSMLAMGGGVEQPSEKPQVAKVSTYVLPSIAGQWQLQLNQKQLNQKDPALSNCQERYNFGRNDIFLGQSGKEMSYGKYLFSDIDKDKKLYVIAIQTKYDNNAKDCSGDQIDQTGDIFLMHVKVDNNTMQWCNDSEGKQCNMTLKRILP